MQRILMVCLGNICRSPLAEGVLRHKITQRKLKNIFVDSAGTSGYHTGEHPDPRSIKNAHSHGIDISTLVARQFTYNDFSAFDRIYVMDTSNYNDVLELARSATDRNKVDLMLHLSYPGSNKSVPDPYFGGDQGFELVFKLLDEACEKLVDELQKVSSR